MTGTLQMRIQALEAASLPDFTDARELSLRDLCRHLAAIPVADLRASSGADFPALAEMIRAQVPGYGVAK